MQKVNAALRDFSMHARNDASLIDELEAPALPGGGRASRSSLVDLGPGGIAGRARGLVGRLTDTQLALAISAVLFAITAWPLALTEVPPYQDLPNHLAAVTVIQHPEQYPEFVANGFLKTNAALFTWLFFAGKVVGTKVAAKLFSLLVLALNALVFPRFVLDFTGSRKKLMVASFFVWPMVHNWFVSMGMLDFAFGVPLGLLTLMLLHKQAERPSLKNGLLIACVAAATWYAHVFVLMIVHLLIAVHLVTPVRFGGVFDRSATWKARLIQARTLILPLLPTTLLVLVSLFKHMTEPVGLMTGYVDSARLLPPWELAYNMFAEWFYGFTWLSIGSLVACITLGLIGLWYSKKHVAFFSPVALAVLGIFFVTVPYITTNWFHVNSRFIPFIWMAFLVRVPDRLPKPLLGALGIAAISYSVGMGVDFVRLDQDRAKFTAGMSAVPEGSKLLPLIFSRRLTSENTRSLQHAWGYYVMEKQTAAPLLFAHSASFPVMYKEAPPPQFNHLVLESFAPSMRNPAWMCNVLRAGGIFVTDCEGAWRERWAEFWRQALPAYDHVLLWDPTPEALALLPEAYHAVYQHDRLSIYERGSASSPSATARTRD